MKPDWIRGAYDAGQRGPTAARAPPRTWSRRASQGRRFQAKRPRPEPTKTRLHFLKQIADGSSLMDQQIGARHVVNASENARLAAAPP